MQNYLVLVLVTFVLTYLIGKKCNLYDYPNARKLHTSPVLNVGGIALVISYIISIYFFEYSFTLNQILVFSFYFSILGFVDDRININPFYRIIIQAFIAGYFLHATQLYINKISITEDYIIQLGSFSEIFTIMCILVIINACNYFDGIDLNLTFLAIVFIVLVYLFFNILDFEKILILCFPLMIFSITNIGFYKIPKMFLGDSGSNCIGFIIACFLLTYNFEKSESFFSQHEIVWISALFVYEFLSINLSRSLKRKNIFEPGDDHLHYIINNFVNNKFFTVLIIIFLMILVFIMGKMIFLINSNLSFLTYLFLFFLYFFVRERLWKIKIT